MKLDKNSRGSLALVYVISAVVAALLILFVHSPWLLWPLLVIIAWFCIWQTMFFMVPERNPVGTDRLVSSVADGRVVVAAKAFEPEMLKSEAIQVSVYMNFFDVHANFWPVSGEVVNYEYFPGKHFFAYHPKSSLENEHTCTLLRTPDGKQVLFKQIAGGFARRIVNYAQPGMKVTAGEQCGIIKFGSRIDIFFPLDADVRVKEGDLVRACETVLAELS
jgi:phosphatidylserine decarboxylase